MSYIENLLVLPIIGTALLFIGSQIFGIELPENEELSDREIRRFDSAMQWDLEHWPAHQLSTMKPWQERDSDLIPYG